MNHFSVFPLALAFSFELGVTASDCDTIDYRAMLARENVRQRFKAKPADSARFEAQGHFLIREWIERTNGPLT